MQKPQLVIISARGEDSFTPDQVRRLRAAGRTTFHTRLRSLSHDELAGLLAGAEYAGITPRSVAEIDRDLIRRLPHLRGLAIYATGYDWVDTAALAERGILLAHSPTYSTVSVAEHTIGVLLTLSRRIWLSDARVRGQVPPETSVQGFELRGKTLGMVGLGRIGTRVAALAGAFGMRLLGYDLHYRPVPGVSRVALEQLLPESDIVSLHRSMGYREPPAFDAATLGCMRSGSWLVNTARAALVDEPAALAALESGRLRGYAVDDKVRDQQRAAPLVAQGRLLQTGHTAWYSAEALARGYAEWAENLCALAEGRPVNLVPVEVSR